MRRRKRLIDDDPPDPNEATVSLPNGEVKPWSQVTEKESRALMNEGSVVDEFESVVTGNPAVLEYPSWLKTVKRSNCPT